MFDLIWKIALIVVLYLIFGAIVFNLLATLFDILATVTRFFGKLVDWVGVTPVLSNLLTITPQNL